MTYTRTPTRLHYPALARAGNKEFWQQFQNYAPPTLRVIRTKFARTIYIYIILYNIYIRDSQTPESVSLARQLYIIGERAKRTLSGLFNRESRIYILYTRNVLLSAQMGERASVVLICIITSCFEL